MFGRTVLWPPTFTPRRNTTRAMSVTGRHHSEAFETPPAKFDTMSWFIAFVCVWTSQCDASEMRWTASRVTYSSSLWLANCCFAHISLGFPFLLRFCDEQPGHSFYPFYCYPGALARSWRRPFPRRGVASAQAPDPDLESLPETISEFTRVGPGPCWLDGALGASNSSAPFRNRSEAFDTASPS